MSRRRVRRWRLVLHRLVLFIQRLAAAFRHVRTGGASTQTAARQKAARPPRRCGECGQPTQHSPDWRDHYDLNDCQAHGWQ